MGWIRTLTSALVVSLGVIVFSAGAMGFDGFREVRNGVRGFVCDLSERALLFRSMVAGLYWHFRNFPWLCKVFSQTSLHFASQFHSLKVISQLGGDFAAISKPKGDFAAKGHFRSCEMGAWAAKWHSVPKGCFARGFAVAK